MLAYILELINEERMMIRSFLPEKLEYVYKIFKKLFSLG